MDAGCLPLPICCQCGPGVNNPCRFKFIGPTLGFVVGLLLVIVCWPLAILLCCITSPAKAMWRMPMDAWASISDTIPI